MVMSNQELKFNSLVFAQTVVNTAGWYFGIFNLAQGLGDQDRIGDRIKLAKTMRAKIYLTSGDEVNLLRIIFFQWFPQNDSSVPPALSDILLNGPSGAIDPLSMYNHDTRQQRKIMYDRSFRLAYVSTVGPTDISNKMINIKLRVPRQQLQFNAGQSTILTNGIYVLFISDSAAIPHPQAVMSIKLYYTDG